MKGGYQNTLLDVDLTNKEVRTRQLDESTKRLFIGGKGLGAKILYDELKPNLDPLSPENLLVFSTGPLTGTAAPSSGRWAVVTKSPLTGLFLDSQVGGFVGAQIKLAGYDHIVVRGAAETPVFLKIEDDQVEIAPAEDLWGKGCLETERALKARLGREFKVGSIGPAGERLVRYACITFDLFRQAGRGGPGAVMGSKRLKALAVRGTKEVGYWDPEGFKEACKKAREVIRGHHFTPLRRKYGTPIWVNPVNEAGLLPTRNFQSGVFEHAEEISGETMRDRIVVKDGACFNCILPCWKHSRFSIHGQPEMELVGPEYETLALIGSNCGVGSLESVAYANLLCDDLGMDTISTGAAIAFAIECSERKLLGEERATGLRLAFGDADSVFELVRLIGRRKGLGDVLAEGVERAAKIIGKGSEGFAPHVKGMEIPGYDPRGAFGMGLAYATSDRGACHQRAWTVRAEIQGGLGDRFSIEGRPQFVKETQDERAMCFSLVLCDFMPLGVADFVELLNTATGLELTEPEYLKTGERIWNLTRAFNMREGARRPDDNLPGRFTDEALPSGPAKGQRVTQAMLDTMLDEYYALRGWTADGVPTKEKMEELDLIDVWKTMMVYS